MRLFPPALVAVLTLAIPAAAGAAPTANFNFKHGETNNRTGPTFAGGGVRECAGPACTYESHDFTIAPGEENGRFAVTTTWAGLPGQEGNDTQNDWDLYVYRVLEDGSEKEVASGATGGTTQETAILPSEPDAPIPPGTYRIYMDNFKVAPQDQDWEGYVAFEPFIATNKVPLAALTAPAQARAGESVTLDASSSTDPDGTIENYAWDLNGDGLFEVDGASPTVEERFRSGRRHVSVRVRDNRGGVGYATQTITVAAAPPGERVEVQPPPAGSITLDVRRRQKIAAVVLRGVAATVGCPTACTINASLRIDRGTARRLGLGRKARRIARTERTLSGDGSTPRLRLKPSRRILRAMRGSSRSVSAVVRVVVQAVGYDATAYVRRVTITR